MKKVLVVFGTRPEAIKLAPLVEKLKGSGRFKVEVCLTAQHRQMLDQVIDLFQIKVDYDLNIMSPNQDLCDITMRVLGGLRDIYKSGKPDLVVAQGDTTTAFAAALGAFYEKIMVAHVEAGLRTWNKYSPFPEEKNRHLIGTLADFHFAPTEWSKDNLMKEGIARDSIWVTGNTGIDALKLVVNKYLTTEKQGHLEKYFNEKWDLFTDIGARFILVTGHRRENFGQKFEDICYALKKIAENNNVKIIYPVHLNPSVRKPVYDILGTGTKNVVLMEPLDYAPFVYLMNRCHLILTDSGGIQEEAPSLGKPVMVMRDTTERPEGVEAGISRLVGTDADSIVDGVQVLLDSPDAYNRMTHSNNPYGDGNASEKITKILEEAIC